MRSFDLAIAHLYSLPASAQIEIIAYIEQKHSATRRERLRILDETVGSLDAEEAEAFTRSVQECCERVDDG